MCIEEAKFTDKKLPHLRLGEPLLETTAPYCEFVSIQYATLSASEAESLRVEGIHTRRIGPHKVLNVKPHPAGDTRTLHPNSREYAGEYEGKDVLVTQWDFKMKLARRPRRRMPDFRARLDDFKATIPRLESFNEPDVTIPFAFIHWQDLVANEEIFHERISYAQYLKPTDSNLLQIADRLEGENISLPHLARSLSNGLKCLHEKGLAHGKIDNGSVWTEDFVNYKLSDGHVKKSISELAEVFGAIMRGENGPHPSAVQLDCKAHQKQDLIDLGILLGSFTLSPPRGAMGHFLKACEDASDAIELAEHCQFTRDPNSCEEVDAGDADMQDQDADMQDQDADMQDQDADMRPRFLLVPDGSDSGDGQAPEIEEQDVDLFPEMVDQHGDVQLNLGSPSDSNFLVCPVCEDRICQDMSRCATCNNWIHEGCAKVVGGVRFCCGDECR
ncbi:unnamed protein product, partial [Mesorhabditis spiculigera]